MSKSIGIKLADGTFYPILEEGNPDQKRLELTTVKDNQETVQVDLYRSETNSMDDAEYVDSLQIENLVARPNGEPTLAFNISLDENNNLSAEICDPESGGKSDISISLVNRGEKEREGVANFDLNTDTIEMNGDSVSEDELLNDSLNIDDNATSEIDNPITENEIADINLEDDIGAVDTNEIASDANENASDTGIEESDNSGADFAAGVAAGGIAAGGLLAAAAALQPKEQEEPTESVDDFSPSDNDTDDTPIDISPDDPVTDEPVISDEPITDFATEPVTDSANDSLADTGFDLPTEEPATDFATDTVTDEPVINEPLADFAAETVPEEPVADFASKPMPEEPIADFANETVTDEPIADIANEEISLDEPAADFATEPATDFANDSLDDLASESITDSANDLPADDLTGDLAADLPDFSNEEPLPEKPLEEAATDSFTTVPETDEIHDEIEVPSADAMDGLGDINFDLPADTEAIANEEISLDEPVVTDEPVISDEPIADFSTESVTDSANDSLADTSFDLPSDLPADTDDTADTTDNLQTEDTALPDIDFGETVPLDENVTDNTTFDISNNDSLSEEKSADSEDNSDLFNLPDFDNVDMESTPTDETFAAETVQENARNQIDSAELASMDFDSINEKFEMLEKESEKEAASSSGALNFDDLYDEETLDGSSTENAVKKTKKHVVICVICAIICIIATLLVLFVIPSKLNIAKGKKSADKEEAVVLAPKPVEQTAPVVAETKPEPAEAPKPVVTPAKENEVVVAPTANVVPVKPTVPKTKKENIRYKIRWGDTLWDISEAYYKTPWKYKKIANYNKIKNPDHIISGTTITIPQE